MIVTNINEECLLQFLQKAKQKNKRQQGSTLPEDRAFKSAKLSRDSGHDFMSFPGKARTKVEFPEP